jgi:alkanesulfonate monooxygenase SsuD/methylene tetrahydromethanopterin reductase-like flavin-dependent oxidoreductase (luciferase family)
VILEEAVLAERLGLRRGFLSERYDIKVTGPLLGGVGAVTSRLSLGTGVLNQTAARLLTYIVGMPPVVETYSQVNGWDADVLHRLTEHELFKAQKTKTADLAYHRHQIFEAAKHVPMEWMRDSCAIGTSAECVASLQRFRDAGADEVVIYGSNPADNARLINLWRNRPQAPN